MERSPITIKEWQHKGSLKTAIEKLKITQHAYAATVCTFVVEGYVDHATAKRSARISLAAGKGLLTLLMKQIEGR